MTLTSDDLELQLDRVRKFESNVTFQFSTISKLMDQNALEMLKDTPLNLTAFRLMRTVKTFEVISIADLSRHMLTDNAQISRTATELGKQGFVAFQADPKSKRRKMVVLTASGNALIDSLKPVFEARQEGIADCLGEEMRDNLTEVFKKLTAYFTA